MWSLRNSKLGERILRRKGGGRRQAAVERVKVRALDGSSGVPNRPGLPGNGRQQQHDLRLACLGAESRRGRRKEKEAEAETRANRGSRCREKVTPQRGRRWRLSAELTTQAKSNHAFWYFFIGLLVPFRPYTMCDHTSQI